MIDESKKPKWLRSYKNRPVQPAPQDPYQKPQLPKWLRPYQYTPRARKPHTSSEPYVPKKSFKHKRVSQKVYTPKPLKPYTPEPLKPYKSKPLKEYTPKPLKAYTPKPLKSYNPEPCKPYTPKPLKAYTPKPLKPYTPVPLKPYEPVPVEPYKPKPVKPYMTKLGGYGKVLDERELQAMKAIRSEGGDSTVRQLSDILEIGIEEARMLCESLGESDCIDLYLSGKCTMTRRGRQYLEKVEGDPSER